MLKTFSGRPASQNEFELTSFIGLLDELGVNRYLEIGARHGDTFHEVMINLPKGSYGCAVDLPGGLWGNKKTGNALRKVVRDLRERGYKIDMVLGDSTSDKIIKKIKSLAPFDAALIDGDHTYDGVSADWENYKDVAGVIALHDIVGQGQAEKVYGNNVEVPLLWGEIKAQYPHSCIEFVETDSAMGIGVCTLR